MKLLYQLNGLVLIFLLFIALTSSHSGASERIITPFPIIYYTPETNLGLGAGAVATFRDGEEEDKTHPDTLSLLLHYTLNNQTFLEVTPELYLFDHKGKVKFTGSYKNMPTAYFGIGNDSSLDPDDIEDLEEAYSSEEKRFDITYLQRLHGNLRLGATFSFIDTGIFDTRDHGILEAKTLKGSTGGTVSGVGPAIEFDTRDNLFYPESGFFLEGWARYYRETLGSDFEYERYRMDCRSYHLIAPGHILAFQGVLGVTNGEVPFYQLETLNIRGIYDPVFVDRAVLTFQSEYRFPISGRFKGAAFLGIGDGADALDEIKAEDMKIGGGLGLRFALNQKERINIRLDLSVSNYGFFPYFMIQEFF